MHGKSPRLGAGQQLTRTLHHQMINEELLRTIRHVKPELTAANMSDAFPFFATYANEHDPRSHKLASMAEEFKARMAEKEKEEETEIRSQKEAVKLNGHAYAQDGDDDARVAEATVA